jgi:voltage-gated potassium channel Kch
MQNAPGRLFNSIWKGHFSILLITLLAMFFILPLVPAEIRIIDRLMNAFWILVLISCMRAAVDSRRFRVFVILLGVLNVVFSVIDAIDPLTNMGLVVVELSIRLLYYTLIFFIIMRRVLDSTPVTTDKIFGAVSAYLLIGVIWAILFALFQFVNPGSFSIPEHMVSEKAWGIWSIYFSFVSLTTIGYGDITPLTPAAQIYAFLEAVCGQIFLTVLIARLVALHIVHSGSMDA